MISGKNYYVENVSMIMIMVGQNVHDNHEFQRRWDFSARTGYLWDILAFLMALSQILNATC